MSHPALLGLSFVIGIIVVAVLVPLIAALCRRRGWLDRPRPGKIHADPTPRLTGVALYAATHPGASVATIKAAILGATVPTTSLAGKCVTGGRLNVSGF